MHTWRPALALLALLLAAGCGEDGAPTPQYAPSARLLVFSDPHLFAPSLGPTGAAFEDYLARDRKLIAESDAITRAMVGLVEAENPQFVLIAGDLTKDGERLSHVAMAAYLGQMKVAGRRVFVVPGNHDIQNDAAESYAGDTVTPVPTISADDFATLYADAGYADAIARDATSLSYVAELVPGLWLLAIDSCIYGETRGSSATGGRLSASTRSWVQGVLGQAKQGGIRVLAMMHHGVLEHFTNQALIFEDFVIQDRAAVAKLLSDGGVAAVFTGHFHANDITLSTAGPRPLYDIETGGTVTYPCAYRIVDLASDTLAITTKHVLAIDHDLGGAPDFPTLARTSLRQGLAEMVAGIIQSPPYSLPAERATTLAPWLADGLLAHYVGDEVMPAEVGPQVQSLATGGFYEQLAGTMLSSIWTDLPPPDNDVILDLAPTK
jgi:hypothetical protein